MRKWASPVVLGVGVAAFAALSITGATAQVGGAIRVDSDDIGGVVTSPKGPEAGVWVIAELEALACMQGANTCNDHPTRRSG